MTHRNKPNNICADGRTVDLECNNPWKYSEVDVMTSHGKTVTAASSQALANEERYTLGPDEGLLVSSQD